jgi:hypothetical protein
MNWRWFGSAPGDAVAAGEPAEAIGVGESAACACVAIVAGAGPPVHPAAMIAIIPIAMARRALIRVPRIATPHWKIGEAH